MRQLALRRVGFVFALAGFVFVVFLPAATTPVDGDPKQAWQF
jgi:hypothetical protein